VGHWLSSQDPTTRVVGVGAGGEVKDDGLRVATGCCSKVVDKSFFPGLEQGKLRAPKSKLLASVYSTASLSHWQALWKFPNIVITPRGPDIFNLR
jgi:hypothetical protein